MVKNNVKKLYMIKWFNTTRTVHASHSIKKTDYDIKIEDIKKNISRNYKKITTDDLNKRLGTIFDKR